MRMLFKTCTKESVHIFPSIGDRMRILVVGPQFPDSFARNIAVTLRDMGHDVISEDGATIRHHGNKYVNAFKRIARETFPVIEASCFLKFYKD